MQKLDRLGWAEGISFRAYGVAIGVRANRAEAIQPLSDLFPPGWKATTGPVRRLYSLTAADLQRPGGRRMNLVWADTQRIGQSKQLELALHVFESDLHRYVAEWAPRHCFVHAGVVGWNGKAIVIPGRSFAGKSTLVAELVRAGASYYSDEYAVLDRRGRVHPFARPLALRASGGFKQEQQPVPGLERCHGQRPLPIGLVVVSRYRPGAHWRPRRLSAGQGVLALLSNTVSARRRPDLALSSLRRAVQEAKVIQGVRGEARQAAAAILSQLESQAA